MTACALPTRFGGRMCEHLRMDPKDDPEARIRDLERPLADAARTSELGTGGSATPPPTQPWTYGNSFPPPPPGPPAPWPGYEPHPAPSPAPHPGSGSTHLFLVFGGFALALLVGGLVTAYLTFSKTDTGDTATGAVTDSESTTIRQTTVNGVPVPGSVAPTQVPAGETVIVSGINEHRTVECQDNTVIVSGIQNELEITGHCTAVTVSGVENVITVESAGTIGVSGFDNRVTYRTGEPEVSKSGQSNVVEQG
ncbi:DUF3060 domain-containing protein [Mycolicibacterium sp. 050232]|uniref:DUF3060 domain-containing protein n=1 Tax=Mycolicibacterium sp. 050232 TaxID=3113982 RepID=UPI002E299327|nr:DUF3060 domain-containing protein [Mycolicibacterium sp. 050232]MED5813908.1 DUF3060 domain-containing protein [Mycolicibacterium sp. 050232]